jgi:predicted extracellular nuclease
VLVKARPYRLVLGLVCLLAFVGGAGGAVPNGPSPNLVISQIYGGGGNSGAVYTHDYIEIFNRGTTSVSLAGTSLQYTSAAGTGNLGSASNQLTELPSVTIPPGGYFLVQEASNAAVGSPLPSPDHVDPTPIAMAVGAGKVALADVTTSLGCNTAATCAANGNDARIIDLVGYGTTANYFEGAGPAPAPSSTNADFRNAGGCQDTDNNTADFTAGPASPRNSASPGNTCVGEQAPSVVATTPPPGSTENPTDTNITVTFSEPVVTDNAFSLSCTGSGNVALTVTPSGSEMSTTYVLDPQTDLQANETCTVTVAASGVSDVDRADPPDNMVADYAFSFQTVDVFICGDPATLIHAVQGSGTATPLNGSAVTIEGVVVGDYQLTPAEFNGFYLQEETADADSDPLTSEGIFILGGSENVAVGDIVRVRGTAGESSGLTRLSSVTDVAVCPSGAATPATPVSLPVANVADLERFEGMRVQFSQTMTATEVFNLGRFGEVSMSGAGRLYNPTAVAAPGAAALAVAAQNNRSRIILDDGNNLQNIDPTRYPQGGLSASNTLRVGDTLAGLEGVMDFRFSNYRIQPVGLLSYAPTNPRTPAPASVGGNLKVATFNVLNYFNGDGLGGGFPTSRGAETPFELGRQEAKIVSALKTIDADIVGLMEIENDPTPNSAIEQLVAALNSATAPGTYAFINTGVIGTDEIKVALIYKPGEVTPVGDWKIITSAVDPRFIDTRNRPSLAQTFEQNTSGQALTVVVNHLKSKGSACAPDDPDTGDGSGNCNLTRTNAAEAIVDWLAGDPTGSGDPDFLIIGDLNSYTMETPIQALEAGGFENIVRTYGGLAAYSYVFSGESGYLDYALANSSLAAQVTGVNDWHINPDEPTVLDYNVNFKSANHVNTLYNPGPYRASDHDPVIVGVQLNHAPTADAGGPYTVAEGGSVGVTATGGDADGDDLTYAWDLDNNGSFETAGQSPTFSAAAIDGPATLTIRVQVTDAEETTVDEATVNVTNVAPTATFNAPASVFAGFPFALSLTGADDAAPADEPGLTYAFDCGDGSGYGAFSAASTRSCPTTATGTRSVGGKVRDDDGGVTEYRASVNVIVTFDSLCALTRVYSSNGTVADVACATLRIAKLAAARGQIHLKNASLKVYILQVRFQSGRAFTPQEAAILIVLAEQL